MIEVVGDVWTYPADYHCITTNGDVNARGRAVMGRGVAKQACERFPDVDQMLAYLLKRRGNHVHLLGTRAPFSPASCKSGHTLVSFPTKHHWRERADLDLIAQSCTELAELVAAEDQREGVARPTQCVVLPRPGCANGQRDWLTEVKPILEDLLDDRFHIIDRA
jgi:hypothetical protein